jgi:hypothetical protein
MSSMRCSPTQLRADGCAVARNEYSKTAALPALRIAFAGSGSACPASLQSSLVSAVPARVPRPRRRRWGLLRSWGTSVRSPPSQTPVGSLRLALEDDLRCGELLFAGGFRLLAGASVLTILAFSPPRGASVPPALVEQRRLPTTISLSKLNHAALTLAVYASQPSFPLSRSYGHARLASDWWPTFAGRGSLPPQGP